MSNESTYGTSDPRVQPTTAVAVADACCNPDCERPGTVYVGDLTDLGNWACSLCEVYIIGDGNDD